MFVFLFAVITFACAICFAACATDADEKHNLTHIAATDATCTEDGNIEYWVCSDCGKYFSDENATTEISQSDTVIPAAGHSYGEWTTVKDATCTEDGTRERECSVCHTTEQETIPAAGHTFSEDWSSDDTYHWHACLNCDEVSDKARHTWVDGVCSVCGAPQPASEGLTYALNGDGTAYSVTDIGTCTDTVIVIPSVYNGLPVTSVGEYAFEDCTSLTSVTIGNGVTSIGEGAFCYCTSLTSVTIPDSVTSIGDWAFYDCSSLNYSEYSDACYLGNANNPYLVLVKAKDTSVTSVEINNSTKFICSDAFCDCTSLTSITIPDSVTSIGIYAFWWCTSLTSITIPDSVTSIGSYAFYRCTSLTSISIPDSVTSIGYSAFGYCSSLTSITIPDSVTSIGSNAFWNCSSLTGATFENTSGWYVSSSSTDTSGTDISSEDLADPATAAEYLKSTYYNYYWHRS